MSKNCRSYAPGNSGKVVRGYGTDSTVADCAEGTYYTGPPTVALSARGVCLAISDHNCVVSAIGRTVIAGT